MICPVCGEENLQGSDQCGNCGTDLRTADIPHPGTTFEQGLVAAPLGSLSPQAPVTVSSATPAGDAIRLMQDAPGACLVVEDAGRVVGIFTERDAVLKLAGRPLDGLTVGQVMTCDPVVLRHGDGMAVAIHKMAVGGFRHIPLVEDGRATGIVSATDLFRYILQEID
ncbi:MAG TPA: CBS domain-containing protein [Candidatus Caenarcaniphilales bacterium]|nr:CBS domain-containing protein [Candidatus Caenarcaniphilales bacterium]